LNCETDFVAKNEKFSTLLKSVAEYVNSKSFANAEVANNDENVKNMIASAIGSIGENISLSFVSSHGIKNDQFVASYVHNASVNEGNFKAGKIIVTATFEGVNDAMKVSTDFKSICSQVSMHIAAANPISLNIESVDQALLAREKAIYEEQSASSGKPAQVIEKMVEGKIKKFLEENVLLEQTLVTDGKTKVLDLIATFNKANSANVKLISFGRFVLGQNIKQ
jgi:elongation factor Ts